MKKIIIVLAILIAGCTSTHKIQNKTVEKDSSVDKSVTDAATTTNTVTTEKADTTIAVKADTAQVSVTLPVSNDNNFDTASFNQQIENENLKISIQAKPVFTNGKRTGTSFTATAIKKQDSVKVVVDKETVTNVSAQTQTKNDIIQTKNVTNVSKDVTKKRFNFEGLLILLFFFIIIFIATYYYLKQKKII